MIHGLRFHRVRVIQRCADVAERSIDLVHQRMERSRLVLTCDHKTLALMFQKIFRRGIKPLFAPRWRAGLARADCPSLAVTSMTLPARARAKTFTSEARKGNR